MTTKRSLKPFVQPELIIAATAVLWGLYWIPLRAFEQYGLDPAVVTLSQFVVPLVILSPYVFYRLSRNRPTGVGQYRTGLLVGAAVALYCASLLLTDVVRALILFYVMPAWGTLAEVFLMGRRFTMWRGLALVLSMAGLLTILLNGASLSISMNIGDAMALASGVIFTFGAMRVRQSPEVSVFEQVYAFFLFGTIVALAIAMLPITALGQVPSVSELLPALPWMGLIALGFLIPIMWGLYWGSRFVDPGRLGIILQLEAVVGIVSAALFAGELFGWREAAGALLVTGAGVAEVFGHKKRSAPKAV